jgi:RAQPRD family integrative conjugative element protein
MKKSVSILVIFIATTFTQQTFANDIQEKTYLEEIVNSLNAIQPLIIAAEKEQPHNTRVKFHYTKFKDGEGIWHNGLMDDMHAIKNGIIEKLNQVTLEPRVISSIEGDYLNLRKASAKNVNNR